MFLQLKQIIFREFCSLFSEEATVISGDNKCKIPLGLPCVNRLNTLRKKFFLSDSMPEYPDHDHRSGNLINPEGYMFLQFHDEAINEDTEEELVHGFTSPGESDEDDVDVDHNDETQDTLQTSVDVSDDNPNVVEVLNQEGDTPDTIDDRQATVDDSIVGDHEDDVDDLAVDSQDLVGAFGFSEVNDNILSQLDGADSSESDMDEDEEFNTDNMFYLGNRSKRPRLAPFMEIQSSDSEQENSDSDRQPIISPETLEEEVDSEEPTDPEPQTSSFKVPKEKIILHNGREHVILPNTGPSYIFNRSHRAKPSTIWRHCNDLISLSEVEPSMKQKPVLALILDDGI